MAEQVQLSRVSIQRSAGELLLEGRRRDGLETVVAVLVCLGFLTTALLVAPVSFALYAAILTAIGAVWTINTYWLPTRLALRPHGFSLHGRDFLRHYRLTGELAELEVVGIILMNPKLHGVSQRQPIYFLQMVVQGSIIRGFRGVPRPELEEVIAQIRSWKTKCAV